jgi:transposase-like protein
MPRSTTTVSELRTALAHAARTAGRPVAHAARDFGIPRPTAYKWLARHDAGRPRSDHSRRPAHSPARTADELGAAVLAVRGRYGRGPRKITAYLRNHGRPTVPTRTAAATLRGHGRIAPAPPPSRPPPAGSGGPRPTSSGSSTSRGGSRSAAGGSTRRPSSTTAPGSSWPSGAAPTRPTPPPGPPRGPSSGGTGCPSNSRATTPPAPPAGRAPAGRVPAGQYAAAGGRPGRGPVAGGEGPGGARAGRGVGPGRGRGGRAVVRAAPHPPDPPGSVPRPGATITSCSVTHVPATRANHVPALNNFQGCGDLTTDLDRAAKSRIAAGSWPSLPG